jgi:hypothetical protein
MACVPRGAQARDLFGDDGNYNIMAPEPGTAPRQAVRTRQTTSRQAPTTQDAAAQSAGSPIDTPEQIETFKRNRRAYAGRGSSGLVLPTPLPGPTHYAPLGTPPRPIPGVQDQPPTILPGTGRVIPNLPHGPENFQERASRCAFQSSINSVPGGQMSNYMHNCTM